MKKGVQPSSPPPAPSPPPLPLHAKKCKDVDDGVETLSTFSSLHQLVHKFMGCFVRQDSVDVYTRSLVLVFLCLLVGLGKFVSLVQVISSHPPTILTYGIFLFSMQMLCIPFFLRRTNNLYLLSHYTIALLYMGVLYSCYYAQGYMVINCTIFPILPLIATFLFGSFKDSFGWCVILLITNVVLYTFKSDWEPGDFPTMSQLRDFTFLANIMSMSTSAILGGVFNVSSNLKQKELERERDKAQELSKVKSEFTANVSHEIRTPLVAVIGLSELLAKDTMLTADQRYLISTIYSASLHLDNLVNNVLNFSKTEANMIKLENTTFDVSELVEETLLYFSAMAESCGIRLLSFADPISTDGLCSVSGDPHRIQQILQNLVANAIKFCSESQQGEVLITLDIVPPKNKLSSERWYRFSVGDNGIGMSKAGLQKLFLPFSQVDNSTTRRYGGTGLGLVICKQLCTLLGGEIEVDSEEGKGTTITFTIPLMPANEVKIVHEHPQAKRGSETAEAAEAAAKAAAHAAICAEEAEIEAKHAAKTIEKMAEEAHVGDEEAKVTKEAALETAKAALATKDAAYTTAQSAIATARAMNIPESPTQQQKQEQTPLQQTLLQQEQQQQQPLKKENSQQWKRRKDIDTPTISVSPHNSTHPPLRTPPLHTSSPLRQHHHKLQDSEDPELLELDSTHSSDKNNKPKSEPLEPFESEPGEPKSKGHEVEDSPTPTLVSKVRSLGHLAKTLISGTNDNSNNDESEPLLTSSSTTTRDPPPILKANSFQDMQKIFGPPNKSDSSSDAGTPDLNKSNLTRVTSEPSPDWLGSLRSISSPHFETRHSRSKSMGGGTPFSPPFRVLMPLEASPTIPTSPHTARKKLSSGGMFIRDKSSMFSPDFQKILTKSQDFWRSSTPLASDLQLGTTGYLDPLGDQGRAWDRIRAGMKAGAGVGSLSSTSDAICLIAGSQASREVLKSMLNFRGLVNTEVMDADAYARMMRLNNPPRFRVVIAESDIFACVSASGVRERDREKEPGSTEGLADMLDPAAFDPRISTRYILLVSCKYHRYGKYIEFPVPSIDPRSSSQTESVKVVFCAENPVRRSSLAQSLLACVAPSEDGVHIAKGSHPQHSIGSPPQPSRSNLRILLCEDNLVNIEVLTRQLKKLGYTNCDIKHNGAEGLKAFKEKDYDVVLMDCQMPILDGYEATKEIRAIEQQRGSKKRVPIVALTASAMPEERDRGMKSGMDNYLSKPIQLAVLQNLLESVQTS